MGFAEEIFRTWLMRTDERPGVGMRAKVLNKFRWTIERFFTIVKRARNGF